MLYVIIILPGKKIPAIHTVSQSNTHQPIGHCVGVLLQVHVVIIVP